MSAKKEHRFEPYFYNRYVLDGKYDIPMLEKQDVDLKELKLIRFSDIIKNETRDLDATVHFFAHDDEFDEVWKKPSSYIDEIGQYKQTLAPDFSLYTNMAVSLQIFNTFRNRWLGCYWQEHGITVIPTIGWSNEDSFEFCFCGVEKRSTVAVSTLGSYDIEQEYRKGFMKLCEIIQPESVICYAKPFQWMYEMTELIEVPYVANKRTAPALKGVV